jgi:hypothetical protein
MEILSYIIVGMFIEHFLGIAGKLVEVAYNYVKR